MTDELKHEILDVLEQAKWCVMSTVDAQSKPEAAIVGFSHTDQLELIVGTSNKSRKFANLTANPHVALAIGDNVAEVQYEGVVTQLNVEVSNEWLEEHLRQVPVAASYVNDPDQVWFKIQPTWLRLTVHADSNRVEEVSFA